MRLGLTALSLAVALLLGGCGSSRPSGEGDAPSRPERTVTARSDGARDRAPSERPESDEKERAARFFQRTDDDAIALDEAIGRAIDAAIDGHARGRSEVAAIRRRIAKRSAAYLATGGPPSVGAQRLVSAARNAEAAIDRQDAGRLVKLHEEVLDARVELADELAP